MIRSVILPDHTAVLALGQGTWRMGEHSQRHAQEIAAIRAGIDAGMTLIDTAEMYGDGETEALLGKALAGVRDQVFLVSKVYPQELGPRPDRAGVRSQPATAEHRSAGSLSAALARISAAG